ncbi:MAG TPA: flagellar basal body-associated FliL family protein [Sphingobium sp.]|nr:flagellar basal body-associated FliL family protein [Sphingobium sp.]
MSSDLIIDVTPVEVPKARAAGFGKWLAAGAGVLLLLGGGGAGAWWLFQGGGDQPSAPPSAAADVDSASYIEVPAITVNLRSDDGGARFLKVRFILVAANPGEVAGIKDRLPVVLDALQPFLRELRPDDLSGSAALFRIKEEMMARAAQALGSGAVRDVLIQDLVQQ